jgi:hypothetical protein
MKIAEIERDLRDADPRVKYWIQRLMEQQIEIHRQLNECAGVLVQVVQTLEQVQRVNLTLNNRWQRMLDGLPPEEEMVESVLNEPEN